MVIGPNSPPIDVVKIGESYYWIPHPCIASYPHVGVKFTPDSTGGGTIQCTIEYRPDSKVITFYKKAYLA